MINVKTGTKDLKFRVQGKPANYDTAVRVKLDHNVTVKLNEGTLIEVKKTTIKKSK